MAKESKRYIPSHKRSDSPPSMRLTQRDRNIIEAVYSHRILSSPQIEALFFSSSRPRGCRSSCQHRLQLLYHNGYLDRIQIPVVLGDGRHAFVYALDEAGADLIAAQSDQDRAELNWRPKSNIISAQFVEHLLAVNDFRVMLTLYAGISPITVNQWLDDAAFRQGSMKDQVPFRMRGARVVRNYPDGYFNVSIPGVAKPAHCFLEVDMGTETNARWADKIKAYIEYRDRGLSNKHFGTRNFRLLTITTSERRLRNLKSATEKVGGDHYFWFTSLDKIDIWEPKRLNEAMWYVATRDQPAVLFLTP